MNHRRFKIIIGIIIILLLIPLIAMNFTDEVSWTGLDFLVMGAMLLSVGFLIELVFRKVLKVKQRVALVIVIILALLIVWAELAVGIFGTHFDGS